MSNKENKENKDVVPKIEDSPVDIIETSPSGTACICKDKRDVSCLLHGG